MVSDDEKVDAGVRDVVGGYESMILGSATTAVASGTPQTDASESKSAKLEVPATPKSCESKVGEKTEHDGG